MEVSRFKEMVEGYGLKCFVSEDGMGTVMKRNTLHTGHMFMSPIPHLSEEVVESFLVRFVVSEVL